MKVEREERVGHEASCSHDGQSEELTAAMSAPALILQLSGLRVLWAGQGSRSGQYKCYCIRIASETGKWRFAWTRQRVADPRPRWWVDERSRLLFSLLDGMVWKYSTVISPHSHPGPRLSEVGFPLERAFTRQFALLLSTLLCKIASSDRVTATCQEGDPGHLSVTQLFSALTVLARQLQGYGARTRHLCYLA
ncbi:hypothetical protein BCV70DRAFT_231193 [Testicularia cyperi]|uniref:Uncharacterized protein n=1 Tax=Testicularia cyperi TaxID=1882483 RepID=A0A317XS70_9BASI|nr:hypothetical protein BCV70DRAFT_231193 [Testicularia cyperi]